MSDSDFEQIEDSIDAVEGGGFLIEDSDRAGRRRSKRTTRNSRANYRESNDNEDTEEDHIGPKKKGSRPRGRSKQNARKIHEVSSDNEDEDFVPELENGLENGDLGENGNNGNNVITVEEEDSAANLNGTTDDMNTVVSDAEDDVPLAQRSVNGGAKRPRRQPKRQKKKQPKVKVPYFTRTTNRLYENHPELKDVFPKLAANERISTERAQHPTGLAVKLLPFQLEGLHWLQKQEDGEYSGGVLADEMGMGKTIQMIALFMNDMSKRPNLVVGPTVSLIQWKNEIEMHTGGRLKVSLFHGANRLASSEEVNKYDVVLTSYAVLESCYRKQNYGFRRQNQLRKEKSPLHSTQFYRVILDEAHNIKDRTSGTARAANQLKTYKRWCLTGTPLQNRIGEMYSLIRFMKLDPFFKYFCTKCECSGEEWSFSDWRHCDICGHAPMVHTNFFNHFMLKNIQKYGIEGDGLLSFQNIRLMLDNIMLRRTKMERADDLGLPPRVVEIRSDRFNEEEKDLYTSLYSDSKRRFNDYVAQGVVLNNYANIFTLITRMRQLADHPDIVLKKVGPNQISDNVDGVIICQLCDDEGEDAIESKCHHTFCRMCIQEYIESYDGDENKLECPVCHIALSIDLQQPAIEVDEESVANASIVNRIKKGSPGGDWKSSTKIEALVEELYKLRSDRHTIKSIVFSQFTSMLDLVYWRLRRAGFETVKLQGSMSPQQRDNTIRFFSENVNVEVFLVSLKAGGVALNLTEASQVFILDPWWNPSVEWQSMDRVHRIGQKRPIRITRFCIEDSIESKIIELQEKKATMIKATINNDEAAANRLTPDDLQFLFTN